MKCRFICAVVAGGALVALGTACTSDDSTGGEPGTEPTVDASVQDAHVGVGDASGSHDVGVDVTLPDSGPPDVVTVDAADSATGDDASDASVEDASDASIADAADASIEDASDASIADAADAASDFDAFSFPDAQPLGGLRIGFVGGPGNSGETSLFAFLQTSATVTRIDTGAAPVTIDATALAAFDVVVLDQLARSYAAGEAQALATWVSAGGGVLSLTGFTGGGTDATRPNSLLAGIGLQYVAGSIYSNNTVTASVVHPLMNGVATLKFFGGYPVIPDDDAGFDAGSDTVVAMIDATHAALIARDVGGGRAVLWGDEWIEYDSEFSSNQGTERFWSNALLWLTHR